MLLAVHFFVAFGATLSFTILFNVPREQYFFCGLTGAIGWVCYMITSEFSGSVALASFVSSVVLTALSRVFAVRRRTPITIFLLCGIFPLVPGAGIYYTAYHFIMGDNGQATAKGIETIKIAVAIALGIVAVLSLPYRLFRFRSPRAGKAD